VHHVAGGFGDVVLVLGIDKRPPGGAARQADQYVSGLADHLIAPPAHFALLAERYLREHSQPAERLAEIAVKNHGNAALNPNAQRRKARSLDEVLASRPIAGPLTALQCCPFGEGAAAVILASERAIGALGVASGKPVRIAAGAAASERFGGSDRDITAEVVARTLADAGLTPRQVDVAEFHDAFTVEEAFYAEASGLCAPGCYLPMLREGAFAIGGRCAVSPSGGLIAMGHPIGPTGVGQIGELVLQLRGEAGVRQHKGARVGVASMVGLGAVGYAHVLARD
jgi:acetyl-CoA acetyltransferase